MFGHNGAIGGCDDANVSAIADGVKPGLQQVACLGGDETGTCGLSIHERFVEACHANLHRATRERGDKWMKEWPLNRRGNGHQPSLTAQVTSVETP